MNKPIFHEKELKILYKIPNPFGDPQRDAVAVYDSPIPHGENYKNALAKKEFLWVPSFYDMFMFTPRCIPDNVARGMTLDGGDMVFPGPEGAPDMFGINWIFEPSAGGSMPKAGQRWLEDVNDWKERFSMPDIDAYDWERQVEISRSALNNPHCSPVPTIFTGYFERLISFMEFENAAVAMIDEDQQDAVHELFTALTDLYCRFVDKYVKYFRCEGIMIHDDWGSQRDLFFSTDTIREMIVPHMKRFTDYCHSKGLYTELHSCGKLERAVECIIEAGFDTWTPQCMNDISSLYQKYGKQIVLGVSAPDLPYDCTEEDAVLAVRKFTNEFVHPGAPVILGMYSGTNPKVLKEIYRQSRMKLSENA